MNIKRRLVLRVLSVFLLIVLGVGLSMIFSKPTVTLIKSKSYYSDFTVVDQKVTVKCYITLKNTYNVDKTVKLSALFPDDVKIGLLKSSELYAVDMDNTDIEFIIPKKSQKSFEVNFVGDFAGVNRKHDRLLPQINITIID